jgi:hypothetical protein
VAWPSDYDSENLRMRICWYWDSSPEDVHTQELIQSCFHLLKKLPLTPTYTQRASATIRAAWQPGGALAPPICGMMDFSINISTDKRMLVAGVYYIPSQNRSDDGSSFLWR